MPILMLFFFCDFFFCVLKYQKKFYKVWMNVSLTKKFDCLLKLCWKPLQMTRLWVLSNVTSRSLMISGWMQKFGLMKVQSAEVKRNFRMNLCKRATLPAFDCGWWWWWWWWHGSVSVSEEILSCFVRLHFRSDNGVADSRVQWLFCGQSGL